MTITSSSSRIKALIFQSRFIHKPGQRRHSQSTCSSPHDYPTVIPPTRVSINRTSRSVCPTAFQLSLEPGRPIKSQPKYLVCGREVCMCVWVWWKCITRPPVAVTRPGPGETVPGSWLSSLAAFKPSALHLRRISKCLAWQTHSTLWQRYLSQKTRVSVTSVKGNGSRCEWKVQRRVYSKESGRQLRKTLLTFNFFFLPIILFIFFASSVFPLLPISLSQKWLIVNGFLEGLALSEGLRNYLLLLS